MDTSTETLNLNIGKGEREKFKKCNLCDYAFGQAGNLRTHMKKNILEKKHTNAANVNL